MTEPMIDRRATEAAMDAYDLHQQIGGHHEIFSHFGKPTSYWVRSTRERDNPVYPSKPLVGLLLNKIKLSGGWGPNDAATRLYNAGYIIVDQNNTPLRPSARHAHLITGADHIRRCALNYFIEPARERGDAEVAIRASDLAAALGLKDAYPNICQALGGKEMQLLATVPPPTSTEPNPSSSTTFTYQLSSKSITAQQRSRASTLTPPTAPSAPGVPMSSEPLNQILYGPPGTGKTYATIDRALAILEPEFNGDRTAKKSRFDHYAALGQIQFVTFHQSFSYEDFVEGLAAETENGSLKYDIKDGVFKQMCMAATGTTTTAATAGIRKDATIWKLSIDGTGRSATREYCLEHDEARIGWDAVGDLSAPDLRTRAAYLALGYNDKSTIQYFSTEATIGDAILCIDSSSSLQAIGVVNGAYRHDPHPPAGIRADYKNVLPVRWLARDLNVDVRALNDGRGFTQKTMYPIDRFKWEDLEELLTRNGVALKDKRTETSATEPKICVLIIDEINRGNIARIFGELITLIEPSKRKGHPEALQVTLPYSKKKFSVPNNLYLIGTMNTADRSRAGLDIALRRRFVFQEMPPKPELLSDNMQGIDLQRMLAVMNQRIEVLLGRDHLLGHAYFVGIDSLVQLKVLFQRQIIPLLQEYFFENWHKIALVLNDTRKEPQYQFLSKPQFDTSALFGNQFKVDNSNVAWRINATAFDKIESYVGIYS